MSTRALPYRTPAPGRLATEPWFLVDDSVQELPAFMEGWDYATDLHLVRRVHIDRVGVCSDAGLPADSSLQLCVRTRPSTSLLRTVVARVEVPSDATTTVRIDATVPGRDVAGVLSLETLLELAQDLPRADPFVASHAGSILWQDEVATALEGDSGLVPIAPVSFAEAGLPGSAAWYISMDAGRWEWAALGNLLVLLNTDNPAIAEALDNPSSAAAPITWDTLGVDLVDDLVGRAIEDEAFADLCCDGVGDPTILGEHSLATLVRALVRSHLTRPTESVDEALERLRDLHRRDPSMFRAVVHDGLRYPQGASG